MRRLDALDLKRQEDADFLHQPYRSLFAEHQPCRWSHFHHLPGDEMLAHVRDRVFPFIKALGAKDQPFARYMQDAVFIIPKAALLVEAVAIIDEIYNDIEHDRAHNGQTAHDTQGDLYEHLLSEIATAGKNGQFRTPRHIIQLICALVDPKLGAYHHILTQHTSEPLRCVDQSGIAMGLVGDKLTDKRQWTADRRGC